MKRTLLALLTCFIYTSYLFSQPTLTAVGTNPVVGDSYTVNVCSYISPGNAGANQTWNLSSLTTNSTNVISYTTVASTPYGANYSSIANLSSYSSISGSAYYYFNATGSSFQNVGNANASCTEIMANPEDRLHYPFTFNDTYTDYTSTSMCTMSSGTLNVSYDGYGTLILPTGTINNAIRLHWVEDYIITAPTPLSVNRDNYYWYVDGIHNPIASVITETFSSSGLKQLSTYIPQISNSLKEINLSSSEVNIYPNPASDQVSFNFMNGIAVSEIHIYDVSGKLILQQQVFAQKNVNINTEIFSNGFYIVKFISKDGEIAIKKLNISH